MTNNAARRRQERDRQRHKPTIVVGDNIIATSLHQTGAVDDIRQFAQLPTKQPGKHRWVATGAFVLDMPDRLLADAATNKILDTRNLMYIGVGCWDCEQVYGECVGQPCPAEGNDQ